jgi:hypothetical protein
MIKEKIILSKNGDFSVSKLIEYFQNVLGLCLNPVSGQHNTFWLYARKVDGKRLYIIDGPKYYKIVFDTYGIEVRCGGHFNAFSMKSNIVQWIKEEVASRKAA